MPAGSEAGWLHVSACSNVSPSLPGPPRFFCHAFLHTDVALWRRLPATCLPARPPACLQRKMDKVKAALGHMHKLQEAQTKLAGAESALAKLQRAVSHPAGRPAGWLVPASQPAREG